jgi:hypothetical protein
METVPSVPMIVGLLVVLAGLALVGWAGAWSAAQRRPVPVRLDEGGGLRAAHGEAATIAIALERAEGLAGVGRHDERRCGF